MTSTLAISLLSSFTLFLGLSAWARRRKLSLSPGGAALLLCACGLLGVGWLVAGLALHLAIPAVLIGLLGYCFGHFTALRRLDVGLPEASKRADHAE
ncbi:hypothetical protein [Deinococcus sp.]|uniref:hypothetical protein n=1 Tax=Deinococcus sp. TaxID=47478 RepID=UPI003B5BFD75